MTTETQLSKIDTIKKLVTQCYYNIDDDDSAAAVLDWCEESGFHEMVKALKIEGRIGYAQTLQRHKVMCSLRVLFGEDGTWGNRPLLGRYSTVLGFPRTVIRAGESERIETQPQIRIRIRKLIIPGDVADCLLIHDVKMGNWGLMANSDPTPACTFTEFMPDVFDRVVNVNTRVQVIVENRSNADVDLVMCALGVELDDQAKDPEEMLGDMREKLSSQKHETDILASRVRDLEAAIIRSVATR